MQMEREIFSENYEKQTTEVCTIKAKKSAKKGFLIRKICIFPFYKWMNKRKYIKYQKNHRLNGNIYKLMEKIRKGQDRNSRWQQKR